MKSVVIALVIVEVVLVAIAGWGVHVQNTSMRDLATIGVAMNAVLVIVVAKKARKKRACCS